MKKEYIPIALTLWAGSSEAFEIFAEAEQKALESGYLEFGAEQKALAAVCGGGSCNPDDPGYLLSIQDGLGIIQINGVLTNSEKWYNPYVGLVSYQRIEQALYDAIADPAVLELLVEMGSPGGTVAALAGAVASMTKAASVKHMTVFTDTVMGSGAMWLGLAAQKRYIGSLAKAGSIGVIAKHREYSKMRLEAGITETVIRGGEFKQLANDSEPLTEKAKAMIKAEVDHSYGVFVQGAADLLGKSYQKVDTQMAQGREFIGSQAVDAGLIHGVSTFDEVYAAIQKRLTKKRNAEGGGSMKRKMITEAAAIAAAASGVKPEDLPAGEENKAIATEVLQAIVSTASGMAEGTSEEEVVSTIKAAATEAGGSEDELKVVIEAAATATGQPEEKVQAAIEAALASPSEEEENKETGSLASAESAMELLKAQAKERDEEIFELKVELKQLKQDTEQLDGLKTIAASSVNNMQVALGGSASDFSESTGAQIVEQHASVSKTFVEKFKVGGVGSSTPDSEESAKTQTSAPPPSREMAVGFKMIAGGKGKK